jgi:glycosyltransferase involved in cell wall biosynthesis
MPEDPPTPHPQMSIDGLLQILEKVGPSSEFFRRTSAVLDTHLLEAQPRWLPATPRGKTSSSPLAERPLLTIGMATYDDYDGVYFSIQAIRLYHPEILPSVEFLVVDNNPSGPCAKALKALENHVPNFRYVPYGIAQGTAARGLVFREASTEFVLCMDSHVYFFPGALAKLIAYLQSVPCAKDLLQGPLATEGLKSVKTHLDPVWHRGMLGVWGHDPRGEDPAAPPFEISIQGLGVFVCRRDAWPGFNPRLAGFGVEGGYIHEKIRRAGGKTLCLPFLRWVHRFRRPMGTPYIATWEDKIRNLAILFNELGLDFQPVIDNAVSELGPEKAQPIIQAAVDELENPFSFFDAIYCINLDRHRDRWEAAQNRFRALGIPRRIRRFPAFETPYSHHIGCALSHRAILAEAKQLGLRNVLVFEDDVRFSLDPLVELRNSLEELKQREWYTLYLGGHRWAQTFAKAPGCQYLEVPHGLTCTHAIAYNHTIYDRILSDVPATASGVALWCRKHFAIDAYYSNSLDGLHLLTCPVIATQKSLLRQETRAFDD